MKLRVANYHISWSLRLNQLQLLSICWQKHLNIYSWYKVWFFLVTMILWWSFFLIESNNDFYSNKCDWKVHLQNGSHFLEAIWLGVCLRKKMCKLSETHGLLHSPSLLALGLSMRHGLQLARIVCHHPFVIGWSKYRLRLPLPHWIVAHVTGGNLPRFFKSHWQSPFTALTAGECL